MTRIVLPFFLLTMFSFQITSTGKAQPDPGLPLDPDVEAMIDDVSADTLYANLERLVGFHTRHTNSDTVSDVIGIGAARRWIYSEFQRYEADPETEELLPGYFTFNDNVCGIDGEHRNVLATMPGTFTPERNFLITAHMDSRNESNCDASGFAPGANDDGSGTAVAMEIARVVSKFSLESTLTTMPVTGEEQGLFGSEAYAEFALQQGMRIDGTLTNDIVSNVEGCIDPSCPDPKDLIIDSTSVRHFSGDPDDGISRQLARYMRIQAERYVPGFTVNLIQALDRPGRGGDHIPFYDRGFAATRFTEAHENGDGSGNNGRQHNMFDTLSALNTNRGYMANIVRLSVAGFASLALAPETPGGLAVVDSGDGESVLLTWPMDHTEPDFSGYMIAQRDPDEVYYEAFHDAGLSGQVTVTGLSADETVNFSLAGYDADGNMSIFSEEIQIVPAVFPAIPQNADAVSHADDIFLAWDPNTELDLLRYRVYRSTERNTGFSPYDSVEAPESSYTENDADPHTIYFYRIHAVDEEGNEGAPSQTVSGRLVTHDLGILVIDGTSDGNGTVLSPTDEMVDDFYDDLLAGFDVGGRYDIADSAGAGVAISDADMSVFSTVLWHTDVRGSSPVYQDTLALRKYLDNGGNFLLSGWKLSASLQSGSSVGFNDYPAGTFVPAYLGVDSTFTGGAIIADFITAIGMSGFPDVTVDSVKIPLYGGALVNTDVVLPPFSDPSAEILYTHHGVAVSILEGKPVGWQLTGDTYDLIVFDFPVYYMDAVEAQDAVRQALMDLGEVTSIDDASGQEVPQNFRLYPNYPNPFNPTTGIRYDLPEVSDVRLVVYNMLGQQVRVLANEIRSPGSHIAQWDGKNGKGIAVSSGMYFYEFRATPAGRQGSMFSDFGSMVLLK